jgi:hypothetical protein
MLNFMSKGKKWIGKLFGADLRGLDPNRPGSSPPAGIDRPVTPELKLIPASMESTISCPPSFVSCPDLPPEPRTETTLTEVLRKRIVSCALLKKSVEEEMRGLCKTYRDSMPPCRLQLWVHAYSKGGPPAVVQWVRLSKKPDAFDHATLGRTRERRPRWFKVLKIRTRTDLGSAIHWNGLDKHRKTVMSFFERWQALNKSRSILARTMHTSSLGLNFNLKSSDSEEESADHLLSNPGMGYIQGCGTFLYCTAWQVGRLVEGSLIALEELAKRTKELSFRLVLYRGATEFDRSVDWEHRLSGRKFRYLKDSWLKSMAWSNQELEAMRGAVGECRGLVQTLSTRLGVLRRAESRLTKALLEATQLLGQCRPVETAPREWSY